MMKKLLCAVLALVLVLGCACAMAEEDLRTQLEAAKAGIAELEALVAKYEPFYTAQLAATYGDNGVIWVQDVMKNYEMTDAQYKSYLGGSLADLGLADFVKKQLVDNLLSAAVMRDQAVALGLIDLGDEAMEKLRAEAAEVFQGNLNMYAQYMNQGAEEITGEMVEKTRVYLEQNGMTEASILDQMISDKVTDAVYAYATRDVSINDEDVQTAYEGMVADAKTTYADAGEFYSALSAGKTIAYVPEGYRYVKHALVLFNDDQAAKLKELNSQLTALQDEKAALENPTETENAAEEAVQARTEAEIDVDIAAINAEIDALYATILPRAQEIIDKFNAGTSFEDLMAEYNEDPGMQQGVFAQTGYPMCEGSTVMVPEFTEAAMALEKVGDISAPVKTDFGVHVLYYASDMPSGEAGLEAIRAAVEETALEDKKTAANNELVNTWVRELQPVYHYENLGIAADAE